ncbi:PhzF family phenazine biosynthesis protein [Vibrio profundum]|uniref:PhzF family phenazine biosynthesis protein n=1 Tax=Vibrio profundum TaxID=2910247 RepID=UPI003D119414
MIVDVILVDAFTANGEGGNPAGVVFNADNLPDAQKLDIARSVGYSETVFISSDDEADFATSFFTTTNEVDFCGHATVAAFSTMLKLGRITAGTYTQRTKAGLLPVTIESDGMVTMEQALPKKSAHFTYKEIANIIGIDAEILSSTKLPIETISTGLADIMVPVPRGQLDLIQPSDQLIADFCEQHDVVGLHVFELYAPDSQFTASCRNFAPRFGISEESATGSSSGALACYLTEHLSLGGSYIFEQGRAMNCGSLITASVESEGSVITRVKVGGSAKISGTVEFRVTQ